MINGFYKKTLSERRQILTDHRFVTLDEMRLLAGDVSDEVDRLDKMSENVIGTFRLPLGLLTGIIVDGEEHMVPMATEEPSVVAAVNRAARLMNASGGIKTEVMKPVTTAQMMLVVPSDRMDALINDIEQGKAAWIDLANRCDPVLIQHGGGAFDLKCQKYLSGEYDGWDEDFLVVYLDVYTSDAMGANIVNTMAETVMNAMIEKYENPYHCRRGMAILTNRCMNRMVTAKCHIYDRVLESYDARSDEGLGLKIARASVFAERSPERAVTHNKGIMNGVVAAALAFGQDIRALEASAYDYANIIGVHKPLAVWRYHHDSLEGILKMPIMAGLVGGFRKNPAFEISLKFSKISSYHMLCGVLAAVGLAQNMAALWALCTDGIQAGHLKLHQRKSDIDL